MYRISPLFRWQMRSIMCRNTPTQTGTVVSTISKSMSSNTKGENLPFSRFTVPSETNHPNRVNERMREVQEKAGFLPNVFSTLSHHPEEFECFFNYYDALMEKNNGSLTKAEKELIVVATSGKNNCLYCVVAHSALHRIYSKNPYIADQVSINVEHADLNPRERAIVDFALKVSQMQPLTEDDFEALAPHNLDREDAWYIGAISAFFAMSNRLAHLTAMRPNDEFYMMGRMKKDKS